MTQAQNVTHLTNDEVLALAVAIKKQRSIDEAYEEAAQMLLNLEMEIASGTETLGDGVGVRFYTRSTDWCTYRDFTIDLPAEDANELLTLIQDFISEKQSN